MKYRVTAGTSTRQVEVQGDQVVVDGIPHRAELRAVSGTPLRILVLDGESTVFPVEGAGRGRWTIQTGGEFHEVEVLDERTAHIRSLVGATGVAHGPAAVKAPMPGLVVRVLVQEGQEVQAGQGLLVLEAMKMENELKAGAAGRVERVLVAEKQAVEKGAILLTFHSTAGRQPPTPGPLP